MIIRNLKLQLSRAISLLVLSAVLIAANVRPARASLSSEYRPVEQAVTNVMRAAQNVVARTPYQFDAGVCFGVAVIRRGDFISSQYPLQKGVDYVFFGAGDKSVQNVDLEISDSSGKVIARDVAADAKPAIRYIAKSTGAHRLTMRLKKSSGASSFCALIVMRRSGGYALPVSVLREIAKPEANIPQEMKQYDKLMRFHRVRNEWAIYGAVLKQGDATMLSDLRFESGNHVLGAVSDGRATDIDLYLSNAANQRVAQSTDGGANPGLVYRTDGNQKYGITVANRKSKGASLIFIIAFDVTAVQPTTQSGAAVRAANVSINGQMLTGALEINGAVMVPLRSVFEALGAQVQYNSANRSIVATAGKDRLVMQVGVAAAVINGQTLQLKAPPVMYGGSVLVPLRFIAEASGATVRWDANSRTAIIQGGDDTADGMDDDDDQ